MPIKLERHHYDRAPIREALIDIQIDPAPAILVSAFSPAAVHAAGYTKSNKLFRGELHGRMEAGTLAAETASDHFGYRFFSDDGGKYIVQFRTNGFTFSRLTPYETWEQLRDEAKRLWVLYRETVPTASARRVALRYINQLDLPADLRDFRDYLRTYPEVSSDLPQRLAGFFVQVQIPIEGSGAMLMLTQTVVPPPSPDKVSIVLDIDIFKENAEFASDADIWDYLEVLRDEKNVVFEGCITNRTRELIS